MNEPAHTEAQLPPLTDVMTAAFIMRRTRLSRNLITAEIRNGHLKARKYGNRFLIRREDYLEWIDQLGEPVDVKAEA